jgi:hypothetical protein
VTRSHQQLVYDIFFRMSAAALQELAQDPRFVGGQIGLMGVLQTWARDLTYHPHIHYLVPGGALAPDGQSWRPAQKNFLVQVKPLAILFRAKFRDALKKTELFEQVSTEVWGQDWVVHCQPVGSGERALKYLAPYIFRVAISNNRIVKLENGQVTFRYRSATGRRDRYCTLPAEEFTVGSASCNTSCPGASSRSGITVCSARLIGQCSAGATALAVDPTVD